MKLLILCVLMLVFVPRFAVAQDEYLPSIGARIPQQSDHRMDIIPGQPVEHALQLS